MNNNKVKKKSGQTGYTLMVRLMAVLLVLMFVMMLASEIFVVAFAAEITGTDQLKAQQSALQAQQESYQGQLDQLAQEEESAVSQYLILEEQNQVIANEIDNSTALIASYDDQIESVSEELADAQAEHEDYYELFCQRASQMEQGGNLSLWEAIFSSRTVTELLTSLHDMRSILRYDSDVLQRMEELEADITKKEKKLEKAKGEQEEVLASLNEQKDQLEENEAAAAAVLKEIQSNIALYTQQLSAVTVECSDLEADILEAETAEAAKQAAELAAKETSATTRAPERTPAREEAVETDATQEEPQAEAEPEEPEPEPEEEPEEEAPAEPEEAKEASGVTGDDVVAYAVQFVGNPYVWGGTSLTEGCDCSGFVMSVYAHFGYSLPHFSGSLRYCGTGVEYAEAIPGDIICYDGHVGIYMGGGQMVNAFDTSHGIIICSVNTSKLIAVRRII